MKVKVFVCNPFSSIAKAFEKECQNEDVPFHIALKMLGALSQPDMRKDFSKLRYLKSSDVDCQFYAFYYGKFNDLKNFEYEALKPDGIVLEQKRTLLQDKLEVLDFIKEISLPQSKDIEVLKNGGGFFQKEGDINTGSFNMPEPIKYFGFNLYKEGIPRGRHYHFEKVEYTYVFQGRVKLVCYILGQEDAAVELFFEQGQCFRLVPGVYHSVKAVEADALAVELSPQSYNFKDYFYLEN